MKKIIALILSGMMAFAPVPAYADESVKPAASSTVMESAQAESASDSSLPAAAESKAADAVIADSASSDSVSSDSVSSDQESAAAKSSVTDSSSAGSVPAESAADLPAGDVQAAAETPALLGNALTGQLKSDAGIATGYYYLFSALGTNKTMDIMGASKASGGNVQLYDSNQSEAQIFYVKNYGNGLYSIMNKGSGLMLDVSGAGTANGTNIQQYASNDTLAQRWYIGTGTRSGYCTIQASYCGGVADVRNGSSANWTNIQLYASNDTAAQQWKFVKVPEAASLESGYYTFSSALGSSLMLTVANHSWANEGNAYLEESDSSAWQVFYLENLGGGYYSIESSVTGLKLEASDTSLSNGVNVRQNAADGRNTQKWYISTSMFNDGYMTVVSAQNSNYVFDVAGAGTASGTNVQLYSYNYTSAQSWKLTEVPEPSVTVDQGLYTLASANDTGKLMTVAGNSDANGANIELRSDSNSNYQKFYILPLGNGYYSIVCCQNGKSLDVTGNGTADFTNIQQYSWNTTDAQKWQITGIRGKYKFIGKGSGKCIDCLAGSTADGTNIQIYTDNGSGAQRFVLTPARASALSSADSSATRPYVYSADPVTGKRFQLEIEFLTDPQVGIDISENEFLSAVMYTEAGDQGISGMMMVGYVIETRMKEGIADAKAGNYIEYPGQLNYMIYQFGQWMVARDGALTNCLNDIVSGNDDYLANAKTAARKVLNREDIVLETDATKYTATSGTESTKSTLVSGTVIKASDFTYNSFMTPKAWARYAASAANYPDFASGYGAGKNTFLYPYKNQGHVFFYDSEVW